MDLSHSLEGWTEHYVCGVAPFLYRGTGLFCEIMVVILSMKLGVQENISQNFVASLPYMYVYTLLECLYVN
jgi:hypothetical protein